jgi:hypothetical protein
VSIDIHNKLIRKRHLKTIYIIAAIILTYWASWLPDFENVIGIQGARISSVAALGPLNGMLLGPYFGAAVSFISIMGHHVIGDVHLADDYFQLMTPFFVMLSSFVAGLIINKKVRPALLIYSSLIVLWYFFDTGREAYLQPWFHILVLVAFLIFHNLFKNRLLHVTAYTFMSLFLTSLLAILSDHMAGNIAALVIYDLPASIFESVLFIYPIERTVLALAASFIMFMLVATIQLSLMNSYIIEDDIERAKMDSILGYVEKDVKKALEKEKSGE